MAACSPIDRQHCWPSSRSIIATVSLVSRESEPCTAAQQQVPRCRHRQHAPRPPSLNEEASSPICRAGAVDSPCSIQKASPRNHTVLLHRHCQVGAAEATSCEKADPCVHKDRRHCTCPPCSVRRALLFDSPDARCRCRQHACADAQGSGSGPALPSSRQGSPGKVPTKLLLLPCLVDLAPQNLQAQPAMHQPTLLRSKGTAR